MKSHACLTEYDASCLIEPRTKQPGTASFVIENYQRLPVIVLAQPFLDRLISRASAVLRRVPNVMQQVSNHAQASVLKQSVECVSFHSPEPICRYNDVRMVFINDAEKRLRRGRMPKPLPQVAWPLSMFQENVLAAVWLIYAQNVVEIQK